MIIILILILNVIIIITFIIIIVILMRVRDAYVSYSKTLMIISSLLVAFIRVL